MREDQNTQHEKHQPGTMVEKHHSRMGPILGMLLIVLVLILGGLYIWGGVLTNEQQDTPEPVRNIPNNEPETERARADVQILGTVSPSDSLTAIAADVESTNLDWLDTEIMQIDNEIEAAVTE